jgi:propanol-preferring alcohol dehydrogenase
VEAAWLEAGAVQIGERPVPVPGPDHALVRVRAAGVCHTDLHLARGDWAGVPRSVPIGHEAIGVVEALGPGAERFVHRGDRVILGLGGAGGGYWCGACEYCLRGQPRHCPQARPIFGTFADYCTVWAPSLVLLPESIGDHEAPLACGGLTAYTAVKKLLRHDVVPGRPVAIVGAAGGLGHYAVQIASAFGYRVVGIDVGEERLDFVRSLGAVLAVDASDAREVVEREIGGVDASLVFAAKIAGFRLGLDLLRKGGLFVGVGMPATSEGGFELSPFEFFAKDPTLVYAAGGTVQDMRELVDLAAAGHVATHVSRVGALHELASILGELESGAYLGRAIISGLGCPAGGDT